MASATTIPVFTRTREWPFLDLLSGNRRSPLTGLGTGRSWQPPINVWLGEDGAAVTAELPGVAPGDVEVGAEGARLSIKGARPSTKLEENERIQLEERDFGPFQRDMVFPFEIDSTRIEARLTNGILNIVVPRSPDDRPRKIEVKAG